MKLKFLLCVLAGVLFSTSTIVAQEATKVTYLPPEENLGFRSQYYEKILELALEKSVDTHGPYELVPGAEAMNQRDALKAMAKGQGVDVVHTMTDKTRERVLLPVRIPLVKGLIGIRLVMVEQEDKSKFTGISNIDDLKKYSFGQGYDWPDTEILKFNGLNVNTTQDYGALFTMLENDVIDGFPRAVFEIYGEIMERKAKNFSVADGFYIYYPAAMYFFVKKDLEGQKLQKRLEAGLRIAIQDGSFDKLFNAQMGEFLKLAKLNERIGIKLENPMLSGETPVDESELWYLNM